jgi:hypothetical protein
MSVTGNTQLQATKNDLIAAIVQKELRAKAVLLPSATDYSFLAGKGMRSVSLPKLESFSVTNRASAAAGPLSTLVADVDKIDLNFRAYISYLIDSMDELQASFEVEAEYAKRAASAHGRYVDQQLIAAVDGAAFEVATVTGNVDKTKFLKMRSALLKHNADVSKMWFWASVAQEEALLAIDEFIRADSYGAQPTSLQTGVLGRLYGIPVVTSNLLADGQYFMGEMDGLAIAFQRSPQVDEQKAIEYGTGTVRKAIDQLFGVKAMQIGVDPTGASIVGATKSPLLAKPTV